ncbi:MAG: hypothetical protein MZV49_03220 [Rhodopseudomonas palustris]|nr:hypothetical protein [Rhodopseudomonas palustris]
MAGVCLSFAADRAAAASLGASAAALQAADRSMTIEGVLPLQQVQYRHGGGHRGGGVHGGGGPRYGGGGPRVHGGGGRYHGGRWLSPSSWRWRQCRCSGGRRYRRHHDGHCRRTGRARSGAPRAPLLSSAALLLAMIE